MSYSVKEIFLSLCGEGANIGRAAVFLRFAGCNLGYAVCPWCDTDFVGTDGPNGGKFETPDELASVCKRLWDSGASGLGDPLCVCTGGEPMLQLDLPLIAALHAARFKIAVETNGTRAVPLSVDWVTVSPKAGTVDSIVQRRGDELKLVYPQEGVDPEQFISWDFRRLYLQPMDGPDVERNTALAVGYVLGHPWWRLSAQMHKRWGLK